METYINATVNGRRYTVDAINRADYETYEEYCQALYIAVRIWRLKYSGNFTVKASRRRCKYILNAYV